ncbi:cytochrome P450 [Ectothiorhodospiraceae bacterium WFHF3C12]|nr:cytochrome P450 [Ectothiorhodospiraceae bacterium WFHF3C12]
MGTPRQEDWNPVSPEILDNQRAAYDRMREQCPVAYSEYQGWTLFRHEDITRVLHDPDTFSNAVSRHISVPNGMDPPQHTVYRQLIEPYFSEARVAGFEPDCEAIANGVLEAAGTNDTVEVMEAVARPFAAAAQCAFLGWPNDLGPTLVEWTLENQQATLERDRPRLARLAETFQGYVSHALNVRRDAGLNGDDATSRLMRERVDGRPLSDVEIVSILRNWTVGEIGTLSAAIGIIVHALAHDRALQRQLRDEPALCADAIEEILRWHGPLVDNRRVATQPATLGERHIEAGDRLTLNWVAANRDPEAFAEPDTIDLSRDQSGNLLWGAGMHVCPGAPLARMELRVFLEALLARTSRLSPISNDHPEPAGYPGSGYHRLPARLDDAPNGN